jgi:Bromodomain
MDLGTIKKNIVDRKYKTLVEANEDVKLVWYNCQLYNAE